MIALEIVIIALLLFLILSLYIHDSADVKVTRLLIEAMQQMNKKITGK